MACNWVYIRLAEVVHENYRNIHGKLIVLALLDALGMLVISYVFQFIVEESGDLCGKFVMGVASFNQTINSIVRNFVQGVVRSYAWL